MDRETVLDIIQAQSLQLMRQGIIKYSGGSYEEMAKIVRSICAQNSDAFIGGITVRFDAFLSGTDHPRRKETD